MLFQRRPTWDVVRGQKFVVFLKLEITQASGGSVNLEELGREHDLSPWGVDTV